MRRTKRITTGVKTKNFKTMGFFGIVYGLAEETYGIITDDDEHVKKGARRACIGAGTMLVGDVFGVSDSIAIAADVAEACDA